MIKIQVTLPDQSVKTIPSGATPQDIADSIGPRLAHDVVAANVNGNLVDLNLNLKENCTLKLLTGDTVEGHDVLLHSTAHLMAHAVKYLFPDVKITIGPTIENGFYYDFDLDSTFSNEDLEKIENKMRELANAGYDITRQELSKKDAIKLFTSMGEIYKVEIIGQIDPEETISAYTQDDFTDLCRGPHVSNTSKIKYFKLLNISGAYWRGDENNKMLQRIYGTVFSKKNELDRYLNMLDEAKQRDHRKLGKELEIYTFDNDVGPGLPLWLPNGTVIIDELEQLAKQTERRAGYKQVRTPHLTKGSLYERSGHLTHFKESMYPAMDVDGIKYYVKPMNCPHHHKIFSASPRSYRDLPFRLSEYGTCYRYERSGQLFGLMRVRSLQMNDAHIYCKQDQFKDEFLQVCKMYLQYFKIFGIEKFTMRLSLHEKKGLGKKYVNEPELWVETEKWVREALQEGDIEFVEVPGEAAFYGPKIDVQVWSAIGKEFTLATNQVDFAIPRRFNLTYTDADGSENTPICIHRAPLGTHERFIGFLIEHFGGNFPLWLAPVQVAVLPVSDRVLPYAQQVTEALYEEDIRVTLNERADKVGSKIRQAELSKINVMLIVGLNEVENGTVSVRRRFKGNIGSVSIETLISDLKSEIKNRSMTHKQEADAEA